MSEAAKLWELVKDWPEDAKPDIVYEYLGDYCSPSESVWHDDDYPRRPTADRHAAALHVASAIEWACQRGYMPECYIDGETGEPDQQLVYVVTFNPFREPSIQGEGPTLIEAVSAAIKAVQGNAKPQLVKPGGKRLPPGPLPEVNPLCGYTTVGTAAWTGSLVNGPPRIGQAVLSNGDWQIGDDVSVHGINGLEIPPGMPVHTVVCIDGKARALDADGKIIASNVPGDEVATPTPPHP